MYTKKYGPLRGPTFSSCGGLRPTATAFFAFWCPAVTFVTNSSTLSNFEKNSQKQNPNKINNPIIQRVQKYTKKIIKKN